MASGTINGTTDNKYITCRYQWSSTKDTTNNRSKVSVTLQLRKSSSSTAGTSGTGYFRLKYGSKTLSYTKSGISIPADGVWRTLKKWDLGYISHESNGKKSLALSLVNSGNYSGLPGTSYNNSYLSGTAVLDTITQPAPPPTYRTITATAGEGGSISPGGVRSLVSGGSMTFSITPNEGYEIANVLVNGASVGKPSSYTFSNVTSNRTISASFVEIEVEPVEVVIIEQPHTVESTGIIAKLRYFVAYTDSGNRPATVEVYRGDTSGEPVFSGSFFPNTDINLTDGAGTFSVEEFDDIVVVITTTYPIVNGHWAIDVFEANDDQTITHLGYADDQLVAMTANNQLWNGSLHEKTVRNAKEIADPGAMSFAANLVQVGGGFTISAAATSTNVFRISVAYTLVNRFGPTKPSPMLTFYASKPTVEWTTSSFVTVKGVAPNGDGVLAVELYYAEGDYQEPAFLGRVSVPELPSGATKPWEFNWTGYQMDTSSWLVANLTVPTQNYTNGVPASKMSVLDGQLYFWGNSEHPYRIWVGGKPGNRFSVSPGTGGGFVDADPGTGAVISDVLKFKTQQGAAIVTTVTDNKNSSKEARFNLVESNISISNEQSVSGWMAEKVAGTVGCKSEHGALVAGDGLYAVSRYGLAITTLTMEYNSQLQVMYVSDPIEPVFLKQYGHQLKSSVLHEINGILYMTFGAPDGTLDNVIFCYDIGLKAWWTYTLEVDEPILNMINIDYEGAQEGLGIITKSGVYLLPTTQGSAPTELPLHDVLIESGELSTVQPLQAVHHLTQLEFRFDYFIGELDIIVKMVDQFGRVVTTRKHVRHDVLKHQLAEHIRIDQVVESYSITLIGKANFRMTHFIANLYPKPARIGIVNGFNSSQSHGTSGLIRRTFNSYNELKNTILPEPEEGDIPVYIQPIDD